MNILLGIKGFNTIDDYRLTVVRCSMHHHLFEIKYILKNSHGNSVFRSIPFELWTWTWH